jgi:hypothetical protein
VTTTTPPHATDLSSRPSIERDITLRSVTLIAAVVVALTFIFGFGNVLDLALRLGVPRFIAPLVAPAVDLSVVGLLVGTRYLAVRGASPAQLRPAHRLLAFTSAATLALNVIDPLVTGQVGKAAFDAVGPLLLIGWVEVAPGLLHAIANTGPASTPLVQAAGPLVNDDLDIVEDSVGTVPDDIDGATVELVVPQPPETVPVDGTADVPSRSIVEATGRLNHAQGEPGRQPIEDLLEQARQIDGWHRGKYLRPVSAETLRKRLRIGAARSRLLVGTIRSEARNSIDANCGRRGGVRSAAATSSV